MANEQNDNSSFFDSLGKKFNLWTEEPEKLAFNNPVLNGMFNGGISRRSVIQIAAQSGVGKSTLAIVMAKELCEKGENVLYIDAEKGLNVNMMMSTGIYKYLRHKDNPTGNFIVVSECDCTAVNNLINEVCNSEACSFIILDSLGSLDSGIYDIGGTDANNPKVGADTKSIKIIMKTMNKCSMEHNTSFICINHLAQSIGTYIPTENPTGGRAPIYLSDIVIKLTKKSSEFEKQNLGQKVEYEAIKSRQGAGKTKVPFYIRFGQGIAMIPTYREIIENVDITFNGEPHKLLETRGGGNGSLYIKDEEFKFRGEAQLMKLISSNYEYIKSLVPWKTFEVQPVKSDIYDIEEPDLEINTISEESSVPSDLSSIEVIEKSGNISYFNKGIDSTGQEYYLGYDSELDAIVLSYDGSEECDKPKKSVYNSLNKKLNNYLKECEKDMKS